jgi:chaperonin GroEL
MEEFGYSPKDILFDKEGRDKLINGITILSKAVKSTLGPRGRTVLIESPNHTHGITVTKDGITVAKSIFLLDPVENLAVKILKEAADRTATSAGDGTTTAIVLTEAIVRQGQDLLNEKHNVTEVIKNINSVANGIIHSLERSSKKVSGKTLHNVASISANNDNEIGKIISSAYTKVGKNGIVTIENSQTAETYSEFTNGIKIGRGYTSNMFVNDFKNDECIMDDVLVLVTDQEISNILSIEGVLKTVIQENKKLLIIGPCNQNVINTLAVNVVKNKLKFCNIAPPEFGYKMNELMSDIAISLGAKYFSESTGDDLSLITIEDLGKADRIIIGRDTSSIIKPASKDKEVTDRVAQLWLAHDAAQKKNDKEFIKHRIASLTGGIAVIYVGGNSDLEQKERKDRVDDAVCAVRSALEEGILPGGGLALFNESYRIIADADDMIEDISPEKYVAMQIMARAIQAPLLQIHENAGNDGYDIMEQCASDANTGYDVKNDMYGDMYEMGIIDPLKVTKNALKNAVSVATTILSTNAIITMTRA